MISRILPMMLACLLASPAFAQSFYVSYDNGQICLVDSSGVATPFGTANSPEGMIVDAFGNLYVADSADNVVYKFTPNGARAVFATLDNMASPGDVAIDSAGRIYVAETGLNRVTQFAPDGTFLGVYLDMEAGPEAITFSQNDFLFVAAARVTVLPTGTMGPGGLPLHHQQVDRPCRAVPFGKGGRSTIGVRDDDVDLGARGFYAQQRTRQESTASA